MRDDGYLNTDNYRDLLIVNVSEKFYVVEAPTHEANAGDLVQFKDEWNAPLIGRVVEKTFCGKGGEEYRCWSLLHTIHPAEKIYKAMWVAEASEIT